MSTFPATFCPRDPNERDRQVHEAVRALMAEQGFHISMDAVAMRVGCSKQTLYNHYGSKQGLLQSIMRDQLNVSAAVLSMPDQDIRRSLTTFAIAQLERLNDPAVFNAVQLAVAQAGQPPEEIRTLYRDSIAALQDHLATWLHNAMQQGHLRHDDPHCAAELLLGMILGLELERRHLFVTHRSGEELGEWASFAIDCFLRAFAPSLPSSD
ncbi:MAG: TetR/AcrR family transcriptional regulator [Xanthomonadaceae bacterium]|jgi:AcrR family transcriptional regulator|nr:TetR/AcrR family transcriptional regulator [Xanthomonadaceae bacterium]